MSSLVSKLRMKFETNNKFRKFSYYAILVVLCLYVFSIPSFANRVGLNYICYALVALLIGLVFLHVLIFGLKKKVDKRIFIIVIFIGTSLIGTLSYSHQFRGLLTLVLLAISMFAIYFAMVIIDNNDLLFGIFTFAFFAFAIYYIYFYRDAILNYASYSYDEFRLGWDFENPNTVGSFMTMAISLSLFFVLFRKTWVRFLFLIPSAAFLLVGFTTGSRTFIISLFVIAICFILFKFKKHIIIASLIIVGLIVLSVVLINSLPFLSTIKYRLDDTLSIFANGGASGSTLERVLWQKYGFYLASRRLFFGFGESGFALASGVKTYTHGNFSEVLCDFGLVGFLLFYCFNLGPAFISLFSKKKDRDYVITILIVLLINGFLSVYYYDKCTYVIMAYCYYLLDNAKPEIKLRRKVILTDYLEVTV